MSINLKIENKHLFLISAIFVFLLGIGIVFGSWSENDHKVWHDAKNIKIKVKDPYGGAEDILSLQEATDNYLVNKCKYIQKTIDGNSRKVSGSISCEGDYKIISGGCKVAEGSNSKIYASIPDISTNSWFCDAKTGDHGGLKIYAVCCSHFFISSEG